MGCTYQAILAMFVVLKVEFAAAVLPTQRESLKSDTLPNTPFGSYAGRDTIMRREIEAFEDKSGSSVAPTVFLEIDSAGRGVRTSVGLGRPHHHSRPGIAPNSSLMIERSLGTVVPIAGASEHTVNSTGTSSAKDIIESRFSFPIMTDFYQMFDRVDLSLDYSLVSALKGSVDDYNTITVLEEEMLACMQVLTVVECMNRLGSYGVSRLHSYGYFFVRLAEWERPDWMSHPVIQSKRLTTVVLPMTHCSGCFETFVTLYNDDGLGESANYIKQDYDVYQQLMLGVRAFDIGVAVNTVVQRLYVANGVLMVALERVLDDIRSFLVKYPFEVVMLDMRIASLSNRSEYGSTQPLLYDPSNDLKLPGEDVHDIVMAVLGDYVALHLKWTSIMRSVGRSPKIGDLVSASARVIYFWEGQQVLCTSLSECRETPGWTKPGSFGFAFGEPFPLGGRPGSGKVVEPMCIAPSGPLTNSSNPADLVIMLRQYSIYLDQYMYGNVPDCYILGYELPSLHGLPLFHRLDAYLTLSEKQAESKAAIFSHQKEVYVRGEAVTIRSDAERVNYLMLLWMMSKGNTNMWAGSNTIAFDFVSPILVHRMISTAQEQPDCGYILQCWNSGSCFSATLDAYEDNTCLDDQKMDRFTWSHAERDWVMISWEFRYMTFLCLWLSVKMACVYVLIVDTCGPVGCCNLFRRVDVTTMEVFVDAVDAGLVGNPAKIPSS